jgi:two-component system, LytTR family, response regulator
MLHAILIDDETQALKALEILLTGYVGGVKVVATSTDPVSAIGMINNYRPDVIFLDINMPVLNGFELLEKLEFTDFELVFCTAHHEYALRAVKKNAMDYVLKPVNVDELRVTVKRLEERRHLNRFSPELFRLLLQEIETQRYRVPLHSKSEIGYIPREKIIYIEASSHHSLVVLTNGNAQKVSYALKDYESMLCSEGSMFFRVHSSFIINVNHVTRYLKEGGGYVVMESLKKIPVSRAKRDELFARLHLIA